MESDLQKIEESGRARETIIIELWHRDHKSTHLTVANDEIPAQCEA